MKYNRLGDSNILISEIGLGCMSLRTDTPEESKYIIHKSIDAGINYFDTADLYDFGANEQLLGKAIKAQREKVVVASKVGNKWNADKSGWTWDVSAEYIYKAIDQSLQRLQTDYIDLYQIHGGTKEDNFEEVVETLEKLVELGKIRAYGISSIRPNVFTRFASESNIVSNMMQFSLFDTRPVSYVKEIKEANVSILARGAFAQGLLLGKPVRSYLDYSQEEVERMARAVEKLAAENGISVEALSLAYLLQEQQITSAVVGVRTKEQLDSLLLAQNEIYQPSIDFSKLSISLINYTAHID